MSETHIKTLKRHLDHWKHLYAEHICEEKEGKEIIEALQAAIEALQTEFCEEAISRRAVDMLVDELARAISDERCCISRGRSTATIMQDILDLPPVQPTVNCKNCVFRMGYGTGIDEGVLNALPKKTKEGE